MLVNAVVGVPEELKVRVRLRSEFIRLQLLDILASLHRTPHVEVVRQVEVFESEMIEDNVVEIGFWFHDEDYANTDVYKQDLALYRIEEQDDLIIPPNGYQMTQGFHSFDHPIRLDSFQPHGHLRMNAASLEIFYPETGRTEAISQISKWSATWHHSHIYDPDVAPLLPAGAVLVLKQWYDNTADNPNNPDPDQWVVGGSRTGDEMTHAWLAITHLDDEGYEKLVAERKEREDRSIAGQD